MLTITQLLKVADPAWEAEILDSESITLPGPHSGLRLRRAKIEVYKNLKQAELYLGKDLFLRVTTLLVLLIVTRSLPGTLGVEMCVLN